MKSNIYLQLVSAFIIADTFFAFLVVNIIKQEYYHKYLVGNTYLYFFCHVNHIVGIVAASMSAESFFI